MYFAHFPLKKPLEFLGNGGDCWGKNCPPPFCNCLRGKHKVCIASFQGSNVDFDGAKAKCASFSMTLATFDDAAEVDKIYEVIGESDLIFLKLICDFFAGFSGTGSDKMWTAAYNKYSNGE